MFFIFFWVLLCYSSRPKVHTWRLEAHHFRPPYALRSLHPKGCALQSPTFPHRNPSLPPQTRPLSSALSLPSSRRLIGHRLQRPRVHRLQRRQSRVLPRHRQR
ncbi:hypothetical protein SO802_031194 [Lithocarpus litseifolius]|uniref:Secreted protein n=1 Tax=Lithocarpus litseifolius TaxID=425828 RepID=A0AAW2BL05_9ROSI